MEELGNPRGGSAIHRSPSRNTGEKLTDAGSVIGRISHTNTIIRRARFTGRTKRFFSKSIPRECPKRSVSRLVSVNTAPVDAPEDKGMEVTAEFDRSRKWLIH